MVKASHVNKYIVHRINLLSVLMFYFESHIALHTHLNGQVNKTHQILNTLGGITTVLVHFQTKKYTITFISSRRPYVAHFS